MSRGGELNLESHMTVESIDVPSNTEQINLATNVRVIQLIPSSLQEKSKMERPKDFEAFPQDSQLIPQRKYSTTKILPGYI